MKNLFGDPKNEKNKKSRTQKHINQLELHTKQLELHVKELEFKLEKMKIEYKTTLEDLKNTEFQKHSEAPVSKDSAISKEIETINNEEKEFVDDEPEYILLNKPAAQRNKAVALLEKEAVKEVKTNRREIIKKKIEEELMKKELSAKELKILFVDEYEYCSKATFYRYLEMLRKEERIDSIKINGKEYLCSIPSKNNYQL